MRSVVAGELALPALPRVGGITPSLAERWQAIQRKRKPALIAGLAVLTLLTLIALFWPATYRSTGTILIEQQELPSEMVQSTITSYADQRIQVISQRVMTTDNLLRIIQHYDLYPRLRAHEPREVLLERMRKDIHFQMISADVMDPRQGRATKADIAFAVSYDSRNPDLAAKVANELVSLYLDENLRSRKQQTADAAVFLQEQAADLSKQIDRQLAKIAAFKNEHLHSLPEQSLVNTQEDTRARDELRDVDTQLRALNEQITYLDGQLAQVSPSSQVYTSTGERVLSPADRLKFLRTEMARLSGLYGPDHPDVQRMKREVAGLENSVGGVDSSNDLHRQLEDARTQLAAAQQRYSPEHPDVVRLKRAVDTLTQRIEDASKADAVVPKPAQPDNPAYIQLKSQREAAMDQRQSLQTKRDQINARISETDAQLAAAPAVERDFAAMMKDLDSAELRYREVQQKQMEAKLAQNLEDQQKGERFALIDPPLAPEVPNSPNRGLLLVAGLALGIACAIAVALGLDRADPNIRNRADLEMLLQVSPLAVLPMIENTADRQQRARGRKMTWLVVLGGLVLALILIHFFYRPLDVLWEIVLRKLGG